MRPINSEGLNSKDFEVLSSYKEKHFAGHKKAPSALAWNTPGTILVTAETAIKTWFLNRVALRRDTNSKVTILMQKWSSSPTHRYFSAWAGIL